MGGVWTRARAELRARWRAALGAALLVGIAGSMTLGALAGARRTDSAYRRFLRAVNASDAITGSGPYIQALGFTPVDEQAVRSLPQVAEVDAQVMFLAGVATPEGNVLDPPGEHAAFGWRDRPRMDLARAVTGRLPRDDALDETAIGFEVARELDLAAGDLINLILLSPKAFESLGSFVDAPPAATVPMRIVGTIAFSGAFQPSPSFQEFLVSPAFVRRYEGKAVAPIALLLRLAPGVAPTELKKEVDRIAGGGGELFQLTEHTTGLVERSTHVEANALRIFALIAGISGGFAVAQALARQVSAAAAERPALRAMGMGSGALRAVAALQAALVSAAGAALAVAGAWELSLLTPFGLARAAEPSPGLAFDAFVLGPGAAATVALLVLGALPAIWAAGRRSAETAAEVLPVNPSRVAGRLASAGLPPTVVTGVRMALEPGRGRTAVPARSAIAGVSMALAAVVAVLTIGASFDRLITTPRLYGWNWTAMFGNPYLPGLGEKIEKVLVDHDDVTAMAAGAELVTISLGSGGRSFESGVFAFDEVRGRLHPPVVAGRWPESTDEIALGSRVLRRLDLGIGDRVQAGAGDRADMMRIVGEAVFPSFGDDFSGELGEGAGMTLEALKRFLPSAKRNAFIVRLKKGVDPEQIAAALGRAADVPPDALTASPHPPADLSNLARTDSLPFVLSGLLAVLASGTIAHVLITTIRRRRRDIAILGALGFVRAQVRSTVIWQAITLGIVSLGLGVGLGLLGGRWLWNFVAREIGFVPSPAMKVLPLVTVAAGTLVLAGLIALAPARAAARTAPATALRAAE